MGARPIWPNGLRGGGGDAILQGIGGWHLMCFGIGLRTRFLDDLV